MKSLVNNKLGFYMVGTQRVESKIDACILGTKLNQHPTWHFSDAVWNSQDWTHEPEVDILELYRTRAKQIREQYDYIVLNYSGGSDSQAMVDAFLSAGCFIDEVVTIWNRKHTTRVIATEGAIDPRNVEAEFELTTRPGLTRLRNASPNTKITYIDISDAIRALTKHSIPVPRSNNGDDFESYLCKWQSTLPRDKNNKKYIPVYPKK